MSPTAEAPRRVAAAAVEVSAARGLGRHSAFVRRVCRDVLRAVNEAGSELSVALVHDDEMHRLNHSWRGKDRTFFVLDYDDAYIWGVTAGILRAFALRYQA